MIKKTIATILLSTSLVGGAVITYDAFAGVKLADQVKIAGEKIGNYKSNESKLTSLVEVAGKRISDANGEITLKKQQLEAFKQLADINAEKLTQASKELEGLKNDVKNLEAQKNTLTSENNDLTLKLENSKDNVKRLEAQIADLQTEKEDLNSMLASANGEITRLNSELEAANKVIKENADKLESINENAKPLSKEKLDAMSKELPVVSK